MGFIMIPDWAARGVLHPREFALYAALLSRADAHTGECFPSYETLARESGVTRRQVPYGLAELADEGLVRSRRSRSVNRYTVQRFTDDRPSGYRSRFERGERQAERNRVRVPHSAGSGTRTSQSAGDALEPDPVEPDPVEPSRVHRDAKHDCVSAISSSDASFRPGVEVGRTDRQVALLLDLYILAKRRVPDELWFDWVRNITNDEFTVVKGVYFHDLNQCGRGGSSDWPMPGDEVHEYLSVRGQQWADVGCVPEEMSA